MNRLDIIKILIKKSQAEKYLEIGTKDGYVINNIQCKYKVGIDPDPNSSATFHITSDEFFAYHNKDIFDVIFIDGLHHYYQVLRDIKNSLKVLNPNGYIICHDINPTEEYLQTVPRKHESWMGDCWKAWVIIRSQMPNLTMKVLDVDCGCGVIKFGSQELIQLDEELNWDNLVKNRKTWLNLVSMGEIYSL
jgi:2-polyprenyl-3-methyl-5-hydroxy-6-metoxy-1,4-benzoquinol methylase